VNAYRVLIVEDNEKNMKVLRDLMQLQGYRTLEARDGISGLEVARSEHPDLILMDVQLPVMDGYEVTRRMKADETTRDIPVVAVTSFAMKGEEERARAAGCDAYLNKPINIHMLVTTVKKYLSGRA
jgi:two-component system cell cycle response regulator DivK